MRNSTKIAAALAAIGLSSCTSGQLNVTPPLHFTPTNAKLQFAVGTVNFAGGAVGLNVFETDRGPSGFTAIPDNTATLTGPAGFAGPAGSADPGSGSASIPMGAAANFFPLGSGGTTLDSADGFGLGPPGSSSSAVSPFPVQPQFFDVVGAGASFSAQRPLYGDPPAYPSPSNPGPAGFPEGFYLVALSGTPPTGTYTLTVSFSQNGNPGSQTATATLGSNALLPAMAAPTYVSDGTGGGSGSITLPAGVTEALLNFTARNPASFATEARATVVVHGTGAQAYVVPDSAGFPTGDLMRIQSFGFDYNDFELGPPNDLSQTPTLPAQADVTVALQVNTTQ